MKLSYVAVSRPESRTEKRECGEAIGDFLVLGAELTWCVVFQLPRADFSIEGSLC
jgi:hypothetical protein